MEYTKTDKEIAYGFDSATIERADGSTFTHYIFCGADVYEDEDGNEHIIESEVSVDSDGDWGSPYELQEGEKFVSYYTDTFTPTEINEVDGCLYCDMKEIVED